MDNVTKCNTSRKFTGNILKPHWKFWDCLNIWTANNFFPNATFFALILFWPHGHDTMRCYVTLALYKCKVVQNLERYPVFYIRLLNDSSLIQNAIILFPALLYLLWLSHKDKILTFCGVHISRWKCVRSPHTFNKSPIDNKISKIINGSIHTKYLYLYNSHQYLQYALRLCQADGICFVSIMSDI